MRRIAPCKTPSGPSPDALLRLGNGPDGLSYIGCRLAECQLSDQLTVNSLYPFFVLDAAPLMVKGLVPPSRPFIEIELEVTLCVPSPRLLIRTYSE
ncbi:hypothetical protein [Paenibacillus sp. URB8-2]|uniref:hypothetical protein n=1 Tax=Paenibacillus sp. URB8-2 TaxID=2741301 RepID=UPI0015B99973|nr:hypothetical protein [Paenibacillus sp. URB8-2]